MCVALIGGMDRLERNYINEAKKSGIDLRVFTKPNAELASKVRSVDAVVIFTNKVSHRARTEVINATKMRNIPVFYCHSSGICALRDSFHCIGNKKEGAHVHHGHKQRKTVYSDVGKT